MNQSHPKRLFLMALFLSAVTQLMGDTQELTIWDRDNPHVKKKLIFPEKPKGVEGDWMIVRLINEPDHLEPYTSTGVYAQRIYSLIFSSLLNQDGWTLEYEMGKDTHSLATSYRIDDRIVLRKKDKKGKNIQLIGKWEKKKGKYYWTSPKGEKKVLERKEILKADKNVVYTFTLRKDAKFHDGKPLTAHDVIFSMDVVKNKYVNAPSLRNYYKDVKEWYALDEYRVRFIYAKPYWLGLSMISGLPIIPRHYFHLEKFGTDFRYIANKDSRFAKFYNENDFRTHPIGSGPYMFEKWEKGNQIVLRKNPHYWGKKVYLDKIIWRYISEDAAALQALKKGEIDFIPSIETELFLREARGPLFESTFVKATYYTPAYGYLGWNMRRKPFNEVKVRLALAHLMPRKEILKTLLHGMGKIVTGPFYYFGPVYDHKIKPWPYDPKKAKELLTEAGWIDRDGDGILDKDGKPFKFDILFVEGGGATKQIAQRYQAELKKVGIEVDLKQRKWQVLLHKVHNLDFDAVFLGWGTPVEGDPYQLWHSSQTGKNASNHVGYKNPRVDRIIEKGRTMFNKKRRRALYRRMHRILHFDQPYLFLFMTPSKTIYHMRFRGVRWLKFRPGWDLTEWYVPKELQKHK